jgi:hypothetical protein
VLAIQRTGALVSHEASVELHHGVEAAESAERLSNKRSGREDGGRGHRSTSSERSYWSETMTVLAYHACEAAANSKLNGYSLKGCERSLSASLRSCSTNGGQTRWQS